MTNERRQLEEKRAKDKEETESAEMGSERKDPIMCTSGSLPPC